MATNYFIDVGPGTLSWTEWSNAVINVLGNQVLPTVDEDEWQLFAAAMVGSPAYAQYGIPGYNEFETWQDWGNATVNCFYGVSYV